MPTGERPLMSAMLHGALSGMSGSKRLIVRKVLLTLAEESPYEDTGRLWRALAREILLADYRDEAALRELDESTREPVLVDDEPPLPGPDGGGTLTHNPDTGELTTENA
ncbi:MAG: hypothetical protein JWL79_2932 [Frankiales bacterium]|nr:hypothetical protein [Frankiales bacterium]